MNINLALFHIYAKYADKYLIKITASKKMYHYNLKSCSYDNNEAGTQQTEKGIDRVH